MRILDNLSIGVKCLVSPLLGCFFVIAIGIAFYTVSGNIVTASRESEAAISAHETRSTGTLALNYLYKVYSLKLGNADPKDVQDAIEAATKNVQEYEARAKALSMDDLRADPAMVKKFYDSSKGFEDGLIQALSVMDSDVTMASFFINDCRIRFDEVFNDLSELSKGGRADGVTVNEVLRRSVSSARELVLSFVLVAILAGLSSGLLIGRAITRPVRRITDVMRALADGDFTAEVPYQGRRDEIGRMSATLNVFQENAAQVERMKTEREEMERKAAAERKQSMEKLGNDFESNVGQIVNSVASAATELQTNAQNLASTADRTNELSTTVASATEEASVSVQTVAAAAEELSASIAEIGRQVEESTRVTAGAVEEVKRTDTTVSTLSDAASQIGDVVKLIQDIAEQTNLLALNATIEAARAGEAGKGFAVVASEVKNLAAQTGRATEEISHKIVTVQDVSNEAVAAIRNIGKTIEHISEVAAAIARAVEQQNAATQEISNNVQQAFAGTMHVSSDIVSVTQAASESRNAADEVLRASGELSRQSETLRGEIQTFLSNLRG